MPPVSVSHPAARPARRLGLLAAAGLAVVAVLVSVWFLFLRDRPGAGATAEQPPPSSGQPNDAQRFGIQTTTEQCPAAVVDGTQARCAARAECWSGPVIVSGEVTSIRRLPCDQEHVWETFAIAPVPPDVADPYLDILEAHARVRAVCTTEVLLASRHGPAIDVPADRWELTVLPPTPDDRQAGRAVYRCLGTISEDSLSGGAFRPS